MAPWSKLLIFASLVHAGTREVGGLERVIDSRNALTTPNFRLKPNDILEFWSFPHQNSRMKYELRKPDLRFGLFWEQSANVGQYVGEIWGSECH